MGESMKELNYVTRICIKQDLIVWRLKMQDDYSLHSSNHDAIAIEGGEGCDDASCDEVLNIYI